VIRWKSDKQDAEGNPLWADGEQTLTATAVAGASSESKDLTVTLKNRGTLSGIVKDAETGEPIAGATVTVKCPHAKYIGPPEPTPPAPDADMDEWQAYWEAYTQWQQAYNNPANWEDRVFGTASSGADGGFSFDLYPGSYTVCVRHEEYVWACLCVTVPASGKTEANAALRPRFTLRLVDGSAEPLADLQSTARLQGGLVDNTGTPTSGAEVNFAIVPQAGSELEGLGDLNPANAVTDVSGVAESLYTAGYIPEEIVIEATATVEDVYTPDDGYTVSSGSMKRLKKFVRRIRIQLKDWPKTVKEKLAHTWELTEQEKSVRQKPQIVQRHAELCAKLAAGEVTECEALAQFAECVEQHAAYLGRESVAKVLFDFAHIPGDPLTGQPVFCDLRKGDGYCPQFADTAYPEQAHHFLAFFWSGVMFGPIRSEAFLLWSERNTPEPRKSAEIALGREAYTLGWLYPTGTMNLGLGSAIRQRVCQCPD